VGGGDLTVVSVVDVLRDVESVMIGSAAYVLTANNNKTLDKTNFFIFSPKSLDLLNWSVIEETNADVERAPLLYLRSPVKE
jgi:tRNA A37 threonylcarbamoyladenosine modification protein TsaB